MLGIESLISENLLQLFGGSLYLMVGFFLAIFLVFLLLTGLPAIALVPSMIGIVLLFSDISIELKIIATFLIAGIIGVFIYGLMSPKGY